jgi:hypothetical protein
MSLFDNGYDITFRKGERTLNILILLVTSNIQFSFLHPALALLAGPKKMNDAFCHDQYVVFSNFDLDIFL